MFGGRDPIVHLYAVCWNEAELLPFFFRHYEPWVQRFVIFDNGSTDGTLALLAAKSNVELRRFPWSDPSSFVQSHRDLHNSCWRESRGHADWVVVTAIDEHLHHPNMRGYLRNCARRGITCIPALGYQMVTREFPAADAHLASVHTHGMADGMMNKLRLFNPDLVEPNIATGGHGAAPSGRVVYPPRDEVLLLHYKDLGLDYRDRRNQVLAGGLREGDHAQNWGRHYRIDRAGLEALFEYRWLHAFDIATRGYVPWRDNTEPRFWRPGHRVPRPSTLHRLWQRLAAAFRRPA